MNIERIVGPGQSASPLHSLHSCASSLSDSTDFIVYARRQIDVGAGNPDDSFWLFILSLENENKCSDPAYALLPIRGLRQEKLLE